MVVEDPLVFRISPSTERVGQDIKVGGNPLSLPFEVVLNLQGSEVTGHLETDLVAGAAIFEEVETGGGVSLSDDLVPVPAGSPQIAGHDVGQQLKVSNDEVLEVGGRGAGDEFVVGKIKDSDTWQTVEPTIGTGVFCDVDG